MSIGLVRPHTKKEMIEKLKVMGKSLLALAKNMEKEPKGTPLKIESVNLEIRYDSFYFDNDLFIDQKEGR